MSPSAEARPFGIFSAVRENLLARLFVSGVVTESESITPRMRRVRIHAAELRDLHYSPGQHIRLKLGDLFTLRAYTIWDYNRETATVDLCVLDHPGQGPGARWARTAKPGDPIAFRPPEGKLVGVAHDGLHLFIGDETASVAFGAIARALPQEAHAVAVIETESGDERLPWHARSKATVHWVERGTRPSGDPGRLLSAVRTVAAGLPTHEPRTAYLAGEAKTCKAVRRLLVEDLGWLRRDIALKPFWTPGAKGLE